MKPEAALNIARRYSQLRREGEACYVEIMPYERSYEPWKIGPMTYPEARLTLKRARAIDAIRVMNLAGPILAGQAVNWAINEQHLNEVIAITKAAVKWLDAWREVVAKTDQSGFTVTNNNTTRTPEIGSTQREQNHA